MHDEHVSGDLPVIAASAAMAKWSSGEMDAVHSGTFEIQKHLCVKFPTGKMGSKAFGTMTSNPRSFSK